MIDPETALRQIQELGNTIKSQEMAKYHKIERKYLGVANPVIDDLCKSWRKEINLDRRIEISAFLWDSNIHEARVAAAKLFTQARIKPDVGVWNEICRWVPEFDAWAIADHACMAGARRAYFDRTRLDVIEKWTEDNNKWVRRAALVITLPWTKNNHPSAQEITERERVLEWAASYREDHDWFIQKAIGWWLRSLSKHDPERVLQFIYQYGDAMKPFARKEAIRNIK